MYKTKLPHWWVQPVNHKSEHTRIIIYTWIGFTLLFCIAVLTS